MLNCDFKLLINNNQECLVVVNFYFDWCLFFNEYLMFLRNRVHGGFKVRFLKKKLYLPVGIAMWEHRGLQHCLTNEVHTSTEIPNAHMTLTHLQKEKGHTAAFISKKSRSRPALKNLQCQSSQTDQNWIQNFPSRKTTMDLSESEWHCRCTLSARWASTGPAGGEDRVTSSILLHYVRFIFGMYSSKQCGFAKWLSDSRLLSGSWAWCEITTVWPPKTSSPNMSDGAASQVVKYSVSKTFPPDLITRVFLALVLNLFAHWMRPTAAWDLLLCTYRCCQHVS